MRKLALLFGITLLLSGIASADEAKADAFIGYSYAHLSTSGIGANLNGGTGSLSVNPNSWLGIVGDFSGYHAGTVFGDGEVFTYMFGPKLMFRKGPINPFVQALFGGAHATGGGSSDNAFAWTAGGGLDVKVLPHISVRLAQVEYFQTRFFNTTQNGVRVAAGVVIRF